MSDALATVRWVPGPAFVCYGARIHFRATSPVAPEGRLLPRAAARYVAGTDCVYSLVDVADGFGLLRGETRLLECQSLQAVFSLLEADSVGSVALGHLRTGVRIVRTTASNMRGRSTSRWRI